ncbi:hypothetical protein BBJ28_00003562 [Nothophytophthora sp. Chile5]|nr:hypothetical protein BBJ28_00003562 [Nothophytophthora sp. Chile5]
MLLEKTKDKNYALREEALQSKADIMDYQITAEASEVVTATPEPATTDVQEVATEAPVSPSTETPEVVDTVAPTTGSSVEGDADSSSAIATGSSTEESSSTVDSTASSTSASGAATFGDITSADGECVIGDPNTYISAAYVDWEWDNRMSTYVPPFTNYIFDQLVTNNGSLNYCIRWDSTESLSKTVASKFEAVLNRQFKAWNHWLIGYDCWPFEEIDVTVVGFAVRDAALLDWTDDSLGTIYAGVEDADGVPQCPDACYKHLGQVASADTSACTGTPFDMSLWPTLDMGGGAGGDWGQRVDAANMLASIDDEQLTIVAHEIGHGFGLPDFYETTDKPADDFPVCIMDAGSSMTITDADGWMLRRVLEHIKSRYSF